MKPRLPRKGLRRAPRRETTAQPEQQGTLLEEVSASDELSQESSAVELVVGESSTELQKPEDVMVTIDSDLPQADVIDVESQPKPSIENVVMSASTANEPIELVAADVKSDEVSLEAASSTVEHDTAPNIKPKSAEITESVVEPSPVIETKSGRHGQSHQNERTPRHAQQQPNHARQSSRHPNARQQQSNAPVAAPTQSIDFEASLRELEKIVVQMEGNGLSLQASLSAYQRGSRLVQQCQQWLADAEQQVQVLENNMLSAPEQSF